MILEARCTSSMKQYFFISINFSPTYDERLFVNLHDDIYQNSLTGELCRKRLLYDFGWGQEYGFELLPVLSFPQLISLLEFRAAPRKKKFWERYTEEEIRSASVARSNVFGAIAVIMQDHVTELIDFLSEKIGTSYFSDGYIRENYKYFSFSTQKMREMGKLPGGILSQSYEDVLNKHPKWIDISSKVIDEVYR